MNPTPFQKRSLFATPSSKKALKPSHTNSNIKSLQKSMIVNNNSAMHNENPHFSDRIREQDEIKQQTQSVMKQLRMSYLYAICQNFQAMMQKEMDNMVSKILVLEWKIAECMKKFNAVELRLHKSSKQFGVLMQENNMLSELNRDIQVRMQQLKHKYQVSYLTVKNEWMTNLVEQFRNQLGEFQMTNKQCQSCQKGIKERLKKEIDKLENLCAKQERQKNRQASTTNKQYDRIAILRDTLKSTLQMLYSSQSNQRCSFELQKWKETILENIDLKFQVMEIREKSKSPVGSRPANLTVNKA